LKWKRLFSLRRCDEASAVSRRSWCTPLVHAAGPLVHAAGDAAARTHQLLFVHVAFRLSLGGLPNQSGGGSLTNSVSVGTRLKAFASGCAIDDNDDAEEQRTRAEDARASTRSARTGSARRIQRRVACT
jgi:hypothetical protein